MAILLSIQFGGIPINSFNPSAFPEFGRSFNTVQARYRYFKNYEIRLQELRLLNRFISIHRLSANFPAFFFEELSQRAPDGPAIVRDEHAFCWWIHVENPP